MKELWFGTLVTSNENGTRKQQLHPQQEQQQQQQPTTTTNNNQQQPTTTNNNNNNNNSNNKNKKKKKTKKINKLLASFWVKLTSCSILKSTIIFCVLHSISMCHMCFSKFTLFTNCWLSCKRLLPFIVLPLATCSTKKIEQPLLRGYGDLRGYGSTACG